MKNNSRLGLWVIIPGWILAFAARMAQICVGTDMTSGFLKYDNGFFMNACFWGAVTSPSARQPRPQHSSTAGRLRSTTSTRWSASPIIRPL